MKLPWQNKNRKNDEPDIEKLKEELIKNKTNTITSLWKLYNSVSNTLSDLLGRTNNIVSEYAEYLANLYLNGEILPPSHKSADIKGQDGCLYQVKTRKLNNKTTQLGIIRSWEFDYLITILFNPDGEITRAVKLDAETAKKYAVYNEHQNGWVITTTDNFFKDSKVLDITNEISSFNSNNANSNNFDTSKKEIQKHIIQTKKPQESTKKEFTKRDAFNLLVNNYPQLNNSNTTFSSLNKATGNWWLEPKSNKFKNDLYVILYDDKNSKIYFLKIPKNSIQNPSQTLYFRKDKDAVSINITFSEEENFIDSHTGFSFNKFYLETIQIKKK